MYVIKPKGRHYKHYGEDEELDSMIDEFINLMRKLRE